MARIGLLTTSFPRSEHDLAGNFVLGFARALAKRHHIEVLCPASDGEPPSFAGIDVEWVRYAPRPLQRTFYGAGVLDNLKRDPTTSVGLAPFVIAMALKARARNWDAVVSHWALPCALIAGELGIPHLAVLHSADVFLLERIPGKARIAERIARRSDALLFSSRDLRTRFLALLPPLKRAELAQRAHVCPMGIEPTIRVDDARTKLGLSRFTVLSMSRLIPIKGITHAIDAMLQLDGELVIAGDGPERARLERYARGRVRFVGAIHGEAKRLWLSAADAFVVPSIKLASGRTEGLPHAILEAMEYGLPVVASDTGGISDVVRNGENGFLVPAGDADALANALRSLQHGMAEQARETAAMYHWEVLAPQFETLLWPEGSGTERG